MGRRGGTPGGARPRKRGGCGRGRGVCFGGRVWIDSSVVSGRRSSTRIDERSISGPTPPRPAGRQIDKKEETTTGGGALLRPLVLAVGRTYVRNGCSVRLACDRSVPDPAAGGDAIDCIDPSKREPGDGRTSAAAAGVARKRGRRRSTEIDGAIFVGNLHCRILANRV